MDKETIPANIYQLIKTISMLQTKWQKDRVSWRQVAKAQEGSEELAANLSGWAALPAYSYFFSQDRNSRFVGLTAQGRALLQTAQNPVHTETQQIGAVIKKYASQLRNLHFEIESINPIGKSQRRIVHAVQVQLGDALVPNEAPVEIVPKEGGAWVNGRIVGQDADDGLLYLALSSRFHMAQLPARLVIDRAFLLHQLAESLGELTEIPPLGRSILEPDRQAIFPVSHANSAVVGEMLASLKTPWTRFLWGPPGAGKTFGLARLMLRLIERNPQERILLVAPSNLAVDVAFLQFVKQLATHPKRHLLLERRILRFGYPRKTEILSQSHLLGSKENEAVSQQIARKGKELRDAAAREFPEQEQAILRAELLDLQEGLKNSVLEHVANCQIVATTTAQAYSSKSPITAQQWDTVLVDEVTMVPSAICLYLSSLARKRFLLAGDPRQLGPIFEAKRDIAQEVELWMGRDVFDFAHLSSGEGEKRRIEVGDNRLARITSQRRCAPDVWQPIAKLYTDVESNVEEARLRPLHMAQPGNGRGIVLIDVGREQDETYCEPIQKSWGNQTTAQLSVNVAQQIASQFADSMQPSIAIITPYRAQYRMIKQLLRDQELKQKVEVGTIHQFQGSEADAVIFDMVDGPGRTKLGQLLVGDTGLRLVNVAISRAREKFILLANKQWCRSVMTREQNPILWDMVVGNTAVSINEPIEFSSPRSSQQIPEASKHKVEPSQPIAQTSLNTVQSGSLILRLDVSSAQIRAMKAGEVYDIPNKAVKKQLHSILSQMGLVSRYDASKHISSWQGAGMCYCIDHGKKVLICESESRFE
ncbi:MAG: AAA family ATPase [Ardenticatenaceae bacterium]|nr:AAA family ATPase [Ardenticatenaceae bacterium]